MDDLDRRFNYHPPSGPDVAQAHQSMRYAAKIMAQTVQKHLPPSAAREQAIALTKIEEALFWANAGIARWQP